MSSKIIRAEVSPKFHDESLESMIKRFKKQVKKERIIENVLNRRYYEKPSAKRKKAERARKKVVQKIHRQKNTFKDPK
jgi:small subunit ribosomal protein S21